VTALLYYFVLNKTSVMQNGEVENHHLHRSADRGVFTALAQLHSFSRPSGRAVERLCGLTKACSIDHTL
jgi:hypothetical protein